MPRKIIIDTDPGQDDAVAILLALAAPEEIEVESIVVVAGNVQLVNTSTNARKIIECAGRTDIPVYAGCPRPLRRPLATAEHVHGPSGLDGPDLPDPTMPLQATHGVDHLVDRLSQAAPGEVTLCCLGPLTNIAMALIKAPDIKLGIREIIWMGGAYFEGGNITPTAEFNAYIDPEAADVVLSSGVPLTMLPLDTTHQLLSTPERIAAIRAIGNRAGDAVTAMLTFSGRFDLGKYGWPGAPLHDPSVIAYLLAPELFSGRHVNVAIELASPLTLGMTVVDWWRVTDRLANVNYIRNANADGVFKLLTERLARLP